MCVFAIIVRLGMIGDIMCEKITVLGVQIDGRTAKEAMQEAIRFMETEPINTIEILAGTSVIELVETGDLRDKLEKMELLVVGDRTLLELSGVEDPTLLKEAETNLFLKMFLRYLDKGKRKVFLLASDEEKLEKLRSYLEHYYSGLVISGAEAVSEKPGMDDMIVNKINGAETDCIVAALPSPFQENFIEKSAPALDARVWLGLGEGIRNTKTKGFRNGKLQNMLVKFLLKSEIKKNQKEQE